MAGVFVHLSHALLLWALFQWHAVQSHKILIFPMYGNSHYFVMRKIAGELAQRDNEVNDLQWPETNAISFFLRELSELAFQNACFLFVVLWAVQVGRFHSDSTLEIISIVLLPPDEIRSFLYVAILPIHDLHILKITARYCVIYLWYPQQGLNSMTFHINSELNQNFIVKLKFQYCSKAALYLISKQRVSNRKTRKIISFNIEPN